ncbi:cytochrome c oxidase subunit I [Salsipaludibacter albus]|uniref:cytochrome c oxidase subunit I n=1 Tax=Salsipaludibacter albus TaxID=2849650 RepID=UPI001EE45CB6|nr:cytochrome c oxidase subunit I [Salsipaludibacter albus]MBY5161804.1 cytochrome c oxidase subunit I [Salsipaludibacter albus]
MATTTAPPQARSRSVFSRPTALDGFKGYLATTDHKKIGIMYFWSVMLFFFLGGVTAWIIRAQLASAESTLVTEEVYNQAFTLHGLTMVFLVVMPLGAAFFNYLIPLQIGARDVAFPRLNAFSFWTFLFGGLFLYSSVLFNAIPNGGWFGYAPLSTQIPGDNMAFYAVGLQIVGISSLSAAVNFITTILNMRAPGMTFMRMPVFTWMTLVTNFLLLFALPIIAVALFMLNGDVVFGTQFFQPATGGDPVLWQHLFWLFGHPEVYIMILPAMGIVSEVMPTFSRKPLFGYAAMVFAGVAIGFIGFGVWAHHMFTSAVGPVARSAFGLTTMFIAVPTGIKIFNWVFTMWGGKVKFTTAMLFSVGFVSMFTIGGLSGVTHAIVPHDAQQTDTYWIVAHFHYVLFGGALFGLVSGIYYYFPKVTGKLLGEKLGKWHFWTWLLGFNLTFGPMHMSGLLGQPRRTAVLPAELGTDVALYNVLSTAGVAVLTVSASIFLFNLVTSLRSGEASGDDPWDARTLEWMTPSPTPYVNFYEIPEVTARDEFWERKYAEAEDGSLRPVPAGASQDHDPSTSPASADEHGDEFPATAGGTATVDTSGNAKASPDDVALPEDEALAKATPDDHGGDTEHIHMPDPSYWPLIMCVGLLPLGYGLTFANPALLVVGALWLMMGLFGWILEPVAEGDDDDPEPSAAAA